jgi:signal transduction histidine kinase
MRRHSIFLKIYLWFLLATAAGIASQIAIDHIMHTGPMDMPLRHEADSSLYLYGLTAVDIFDREGVSALNDFIDCLECSSDLRVFLFTAGGNELTGRHIPPDIERIGTLAGKNSGNNRLSFREKDVIAQGFTSRAGGKYIIAGVLSRPPHGPGPANPFSQPNRLAVLLILTGGICYGLARYITAPIIKLDSAVRRFAGGDLSTRVSASVGDRKDEISGLAQSFDHMASRIESLVVSQKTLLRDISHELRSPLARLYVALELCRRGRTQEENASLDRIEREADRLSDLIGQILTLNIEESGISEIKKETVDLERMIRAIVSDADFEARSMNREVKIIACDACAVTGNEELLRRAVENVIRNAVRYTEANTAVEVALAYIRTGSESHVSITVRDHGPGVPEADIPHVFKPFYRVGEGRDRQSGGTGIGLAITETAVRLHNGVVNASNAPSGGLIVEMTFPAP